VLSAAGVVVEEAPSPAKIGAIEEVVAVAGVEDVAVGLLRIILLTPEAGEGSPCTVGFFTEPALGNVPRGDIFSTTPAFINPAS
jgi:hypothetical protein